MDIEQITCISAGSAEPQLRVTTPELRTWHPWAPLREAADGELDVRVGVQGFDHSRAAFAVVNGNSSGELQKGITVLHRGLQMQRGRDGETLQELAEGPLLVDLAAVADTHNEDDELVVVNRVDDTVLAFADPIERGRDVDQLDDATRPRLACKGIDASGDSAPDLRIELLDLLAGGPGDLDLVGHRFLEPELLFHRVPRNGAVLLRVGECLLRLTDIDLVLQALDQLEVLDGDHGSHFLTAAGDAHPVLGVGHAVEDLGQVLASVGGVQRVGHDASCT